MPPGFRPDSAWTPDPSWPPAPPGWEYWVDTPQPGGADRTAPPPGPPAPGSAPPAAPGADADTRTVAIQVVDAPPARPASLAPAGLASPPGPPPGPTAVPVSGPTAGPTSGPTSGPTAVPPGAPAPGSADALGATMTLAPISAPPVRPGSGPQPAYPPQHGTPGAPPPPPAPPETARKPASGVLAALKNLGTKPSATAPAQQGPGPLSIDDANHHTDRPAGRQGPRGPVPAVAPPSAGRPGGRSGSRGPGVGLMAAIGVAALALGVIIGVVVTAGQQADANQAIADARTAQAGIDEQLADVEAQQSRVDTQRDEVAAREQALGEREAKLEEREKALKQQEEQLAQQQQEQEREREDDDRGNGGGNGPGTVFYWNCDAVRAAGAAPLAAGQPGYLPHLDRNGNGMACEDGE
ncbi:excalibur calcium-binding domain-containing protein [Promicromonospora citrea]|uniref:excalibur calcium-binding domain-containing protein n=1 Tax=Promicromonospora citrea TaxID=43677 RepID=UPI0036208354